MDPLPLEPDINSRLDELYDHESRMFIMLYSLHGDGKVDYVTGRLVQEYTRSNYGNPVYYTEQHPLFTGGTTPCSTIPIRTGSTGTNGLPGKH